MPDTPRTDIGSETVADLHLAPHAEQQPREVRRVTFWGLVIGAGLTACELTAGLLAHSQVVVADAIHSISDLTTDAVVLLGVRYWSAPADSSHPYGHGRIETMITALIGLSLLLVAVGIGYNAITSYRKPDVAPPGWVAFWAATAVIIVKEALYHWANRVGHRVRSSALIAKAWHYRSDALSSVPAAIAVVVATVAPSWSFVDHIGALVVSVFILHASWKIMHPALLELADQGGGEQMRAQIQQCVLGHGKVCSTHAIRSRRVGSGVLVDLHVIVDGAMTVREGHDITKEIKSHLMQCSPEVVDVLVHVEPCEVPDCPRRDGREPGGCLGRDCPRHAGHHGAAA